MVFFPGESPHGLRNSSGCLRKIFRVIPHRETTGNEEDSIQIVVISSKVVGRARNTSLSSLPSHAFAGTTDGMWPLIRASRTARRDEGAVGLVIDEFRDRAGRAAAELDAVAVEIRDGEDGALVGFQPVERLKRDLERQLALGILS